jgi:hypothetical protein
MAKRRSIVDDDAESSSKRAARLDDEDENEDDDKHDEGDDVEMSDPAASDDEELVADEGFEDEELADADDAEKASGNHSDDDSADSRRLASASQQSSSSPDTTTNARPKSRVTKGKAAEAGLIKNIYLENFMCHPKLSVDFCPNVNFINGENGSGKSAILAGIQICLGASARRTGRGRNLAALIRSSAGAGNQPTCAKVRITLSNGGSDGYKPDIYGDSITVERTIANGSGPNGIKLLDCKGKVQSSSRNDLYEMLDHL